MLKREKSDFLPAQVLIRHTKVGPFCARPKRSYYKVMTQEIVQTTSSVLSDSCMLKLSHEDIHPSQTDILSAKNSYFEKIFYGNSRGYGDKVGKNNPLEQFPTSSLVIELVTSFRTHCFVILSSLSAAKSRIFLSFIIICFWQFRKLDIRVSKTQKRFSLHRHLK